MSSIGLALKKYDATKAKTQIMTPILYWPRPKSTKFCVFIIARPAAKMSPAMAGFKPFKVLVIKVLFFLLINNRRMRYTMMMEGRQSANEANSEPPKPAVVDTLKPAAATAPAAK